MIALCAPRLTFISYGVPEKGDAKWLDHQGSYMAAIAAGPVFKLLGAKDLGVSNDYHVEKMPPVNISMIDGELAWRQHDGGHTDYPNWKYFIPWADREFKRPARFPADTPVSRTDQNSLTAHAQLLEKAKRGGVDVYFEGDSITRRWGATDYPDMLANWKQNFFGWNAGDFGWGADLTQNIPERMNASIKVLSQLLRTPAGKVGPYFNRPDLLKKFQGLSQTSFSMFFSSAPRERSSEMTCGTIIGSLGPQSAAPLIIIFP